MPDARRRRALCRDGHTTSVAAARTVRFNVSAGRILGWVGVGVWDGSEYGYTYACGDRDIDSARWGSITAASCRLS